MAKTLEEDALLWALDGDTANNFVHHARREYHVDGERALEAVRALGRLGYLQAYVLTHATGAERDIDPQDISSALLDKEPYVFLTKTDRTMPRLNEFKAAQVA